MCGEACPKGGVGKRENGRSQACGTKIPLCLVQIIVYILSDCRVEVVRVKVKYITYTFVLRRRSEAEDSEGGVEANEWKLLNACLRVPFLFLFHRIFVPPLACLLAYLSIFPFLR